jgi:hypothetical protein
MTAIAIIAVFVVPVIVYLLLRGRMPCSANIIELERDGEERRIS